MEMGLNGGLGYFDPDSLLISREALEGEEDSVGSLMDPAGGVTSETGTGTSLLEDLKRVNWPKAGVEDDVWALERISEVYNSYMQSKVEGAGGGRAFTCRGLEVLRCAGKEGHGSAGCVPELGTVLGGIVANGFCIFIRDSDLQGTPGTAASPPQYARFTQKLTRSGFEGKGGNQCTQDEWGEGRASSDRWWKRRGGVYDVPTGSDGEELAGILAPFGSGGQEMQVKVWNYSLMVGPPPDGQARHEFDDKVVVMVAIPHAKDMSRQGGGNKAVAIPHAKDTLRQGGGDRAKEQKAEAATGRAAKKRKAGNDIPTAEETPQLMESLVEKMIDGVMGANIPMTPQNAEAIKQKVAERLRERLNKPQGQGGFSRSAAMRSYTFSKTKSAQGFTEPPCSAAESGEACSAEQGGPVNPWADFVFEKEYERMALRDVEEFVANHGHLPWMRSAREVSETGIDPEGDLTNLLEAVENLFLHIFDLYKRVIDTPPPSVEDAESFGHPADDVPGMMRKLHPEFLNRLMGYARRLPSNIAERGKRDSASELQRITSASREIAAELREESGSEGAKFVGKIVRQLGVEPAREAMREAIRRVDSGDSVRSYGGQFISMYKTGESLSMYKAQKEDLDNLDRLEVARKACVYQEWHPRSYQTEWADAVGGQSTVLVAPTGCGKTRVASMILNRMWQQDRAKKCIFLCQTVPLCIQQMGALMASCQPFSLPGGETGTVPRQGPRIMGFGSFNGVRNVSWEDIVKDWDLLIFTPDYLENVLSKCKVAPRSLPFIDLVIVDETHHVGKKHPFRKVLDDYVPHTTQVLGLTASVGGSRTPGKSEDRISDLAANLKNAQVISANNLSPAARAELEAAAPVVKTSELHVPSSALETWFFTRIEYLLEQLSRREQEGWVAEGSEGAKLLKFVVEAIREAVSVAEDCGVHEALTCLSEEYLYALLLPASPEDASFRRAANWLQNMFVLSGLFGNLRDALGEMHDPDDPEVDDDGFALQRPTKKLREVEGQLRKLLERSQGEASQTFKCILFMKTRRGVKCTLEYLEGTWGSEGYSGSHRDEICRAMLPRKLVGRGSRVVAETLRTQVETVQHFRDQGPQSCKLLITTSVAEEGLDFPQCNAVISADGISNDIGIVQRKGRARSGGYFGVLTNGEKQKWEYENAKTRLANAQQALRCLEVGGDTGRNSGEGLATSPTTLLPESRAGVAAAHSSPQQPQQASPAAAGASLKEPLEQEWRDNLAGEGDDLSVGLFTLQDGPAPQPVPAATGAFPNEHLKEQWRVAIAKHLESAGRAVPLVELGSVVRRPAGLGAAQKVADVLRNDPHGRFTIVGAGSATSVGLRGGGDASAGSPPTTPASAHHVKAAASTSPVEHLKEQWRVAIARHLEIATRAVLLVELGGVVRRPEGLGAAQKVADVLKSDPLGRFDLVGEGHHMSVRLRGDGGSDTWSPAGSTFAGTGTFSRVTTPASSDPGFFSPPPQASGFPVKIRVSQGPTKPRTVSGHGDLVQKCRELTGCTNFALSYHDEEEDIFIESDADLEQAWEDVAAKGDKHRLTVDCRVLS